MAAALTDDDTSADLPEPVGDPHARLNQPVRALIAVAEVVVAVALVVGAIALWRNGIRTVDFPTSGEPAQATRLDGSRLGLAVALGTLAALLAVDAVRELVLAVRTRKHDS